jgi:two-component system, sensor histidine kinase
MESDAASLKLRIAELERELIRVKREAEEANRSKTMFLANMSHEIRTPMNSIIGIYNVLSQTELTEEQREFLEIINISSFNLLAIINDILDLSKIEAGQLKLESKPFFLHEEIQQVIKLLSLKARGKGISLCSKIQSTVPTCVVGDPVRLKQILINLTNNALKFTNEGEVVVSVETVTNTPANLGDKVIIRFEVKDTGIGISAEEQESLFNEYAQIENPLIQKYEGTGLGLSISKNLTRLMDGKIGVVSEKGKGSTFWFTIEMIRGDETEFINRKPEQDRPNAVKQRPLRILLVEDNLLNQKFAVTSLHRAGHTVEVAEHGKAAVEKFKNQKYDLILMDIAMPIMDGIEATHVIRKLEKEQMGDVNPEQRIKIVAVTAHVMVTDREKCLAAGMDEYIAKPYRPQELISIIENLGIS